MDDAKFKRYYMCTKTFQYYNENPQGKDKRGYVWDRADCVIRALGKASGYGWLKAFDYLTIKARRDFNVVNDGVALRRWLQEDGGVWTPCKAERGKGRMDANTFAETHPNGRYVLSLAHHEVACVDGKLYDVWNCGEKCVYGYTDLANFKID